MYVVNTESKVDERVDLCMGCLGLWLVECLSAAACMPSSRLLYWFLCLFFCTWVVQHHELVIFSVSVIKVNWCFMHSLVIKELLWLKDETWKAFSFCLWCCCWFLSLCPVCHTPSLAVQQLPSKLCHNWLCHRRATPHFLVSVHWCCHLVNIVSVPSERFGY